MHLCHLNSLVASSQWKIFICTIVIFYLFRLPFTTNVTISISISQIIRSWVAIFHFACLWHFTIQLIRYARTCFSYDLLYSECHATFQKLEYLSEEIQKPPMASSLSPRISVSPITGLKNGSKEDFQKYLQQLHTYVTENVRFSHMECDLS